MRVAIAVLMGLVPLVPSAAAGQAGNPAAAAEELVRKGVDLRKQGKNLEAFDYFQQAHALHPAPRPAAQLGLVEFQLGRWVEAEAHLEAALKVPGDPFIRQNRRTIEEAMATVRSHIAFIEIKGTPEGAEVAVNGRPVGRLPLAGLVKAGDGYAEVMISADGFQSTRNTLSLQAGLTQQVYVTLQRLPARLAAPAPGAPAVTGLGTPLPPADAPPVGSTPMRVLGMVTGAVGLAAVGYGVYQSYRVQTLSAEVRRSDSQGVARGRAAERQQWLGYGVGGVALAAGGLLYWLGRPAGGALDRVALAAGADRFLVAFQVLR
jgi:hypothetical protein